MQLIKKDNSEKIIYFNETNTILSNNLTIYSINEITIYVYTI